MPQRVTGRPRMQDTATAVVAEVLAGAGATVAGRDYSTRGIAELTGLSQTLVSRAVRELAGVSGRGYSGESAPTAAAGSPCSLSRIRADRHERVIELTVAPLDWGDGQTGADHDGVRRAESHSAGARGAGPHARLRRLAGIGGSLHMAGVAEWSQDEEPARFVLRSPGGAEHRCAGLNDLMQCLAAAGGGTLIQVPDSALNALSAWAHRAEVVLEWDGEDGGANPVDFDSKRRSVERLWLSDDSLARVQSVVMALRRDILQHDLHGGDLVHVRRLALVLRVTTAEVTKVLDRLAAEGALEVDAMRSGQRRYRLPSVSASEVVDVYAARYWLGILVLRQAASRPRRFLVPAVTALSHVEESQGLGFHAIDDADLWFQRKVARASGLKHAGRMFELSTLRVQIYIALLRMDYEPAAARIVNDDRAIMRALLAGDAEAAVAVWRGKQSNAVRHMSGLTGSRRFDWGTWARLTGETA